VPTKIKALAGDEKMKIEFVNPFIEGTVSTYQMMCGLEPLRDGDLELKTEGFIDNYDLIGVIGLSGAVRGAVLMTMETQTGCEVISQFLGEEVTGVCADLMDGFGEIINIIAGAAAAKLEGQVDLALPTVVIGKGQQIHAKHQSPWVIVPMKFPNGGKFNIEISMEEVAK